VDLARLLHPPLEEVTLREPRGLTGNRILVVDVGGLISTTPGGVLSTGRRCTPDSVGAVLDQARRDHRIKAVLVRIDSPGGGVTATDMITHELLAFRAETGIPVHAMIMASGCSGGYYVATAAERIWAHPSAITGSIGVIAVFLQLQGLAGKIGVDEVIIKSGDLKDIGSPLRDMKPEERALLQSMIDEFYGLFLDRIAAARPRLPSREAVRPLADGRVFTASQAVEAGLVDGLGYLDDAVAGLLKAAGLRDARVVTYAYGPNDNGTLYSPTASAPALPAAINLRLLDLPTQAAEPGFHYLWLPGGAQND
jgi:protease-4